MTPVAAIAMLILTAGYGGSYWGLALLRGKNITIVQMFNPFGSYPQFAKPMSQWPDIPDGQLLPGSPAPASGSSINAGATHYGGTGQPGTGNANPAGVAQGAVGGGKGR